MAELLQWFSAEGRPPEERSNGRSERSLARWLYHRRREAAAGALDPAYSAGLAQLPGWTQNSREAADGARWHDRLSQLVDFRQEGNDWPRHRNTESDREHTPGVWIHTQRYKSRRGEPDPMQIGLLDDTVSGWQLVTGRGNPPSAGNTPPICGRTLG